MVDTLEWKYTIYNIYIENKRQIKSKSAFLWARESLVYYLVLELYLIYIWFVLISLQFNKAKNKK